MQFPQMAIPSHTLCFHVLLLLFFCPSLSQRLMPITCPPHESHALLRFKAALNDTEGTLSSWVNGTDCCTNWTGISCDNLTNHVVSVSIYPLFANGLISESLCQLRFLTSLTISGVSSTTLPRCLGNLSRIQSLDLSSNGLSGMIPPFMCLLTRLTDLDLSDNGFNGSIPSCLGNLSRIQSLDLSVNGLSGMIPPFMCLLTRLTDLYLSDNGFNGSIPSCLGNLSHIHTLDLSYNSFSGMIPPFICSLTRLTDLVLEVSLC